MTIAVDLGRKATKPTNQLKYYASVTLSWQDSSNCVLSNSSDSFMFLNFDKIELAINVNKRHNVYEMSNGCLFDCLWRFFTSRSTHVQSCPWLSQCLAVRLHVYCVLLRDTIYNVAFMKVNTLIAFEVNVLSRVS